MKEECSRRSQTNAAKECDREGGEPDLVEMHFTEHIRFLIIVLCELWN